MKNDTNYLYQKTQYAGTLFVVGLSFLSILIIYIDQLYVQILLGCLFVFILLFYKLTVSIDQEKITIVFGLGIFKRSLKITDIDFDKIAPFRATWLTGVGIRLTQYGILYNVQLGNAMKIPSKNGSNLLFGTEEYEAIKEVLLQLKN